MNVVPLNDKILIERLEAETTTAGGIVLAHDLHSQTVDAMPATLDGLLKRGFSFVTVSQLIAMKAEAPTAQASVAPAP